MRRPTARRKAVPQLDTSWHAAAQCRGEPTELFFGPPTEPGGRSQETERERDARVDEAIGLCLGCPVKDICADDAIKRRDIHGIRGGLLPEEILRERRRWLKRARAAA